MWSAGSSGDAGSQEGAGAGRRAAAHAAVRYARPWRCGGCCVATSVLIDSTKRAPCALWGRQLPLRHPPPGSHRPLRRLVRRFHPGTRPTCPQRVAPCEDGAAQACGVRPSTGGPGVQKPRDLLAHGAPSTPEARPAEGAIKDAMPPGAPRRRLGRQRRAPLLGASAALTPRCDVPQERRPTSGTPPHRIPVRGTPALRHQEPIQRRAPQGPRDLATAGEAHQQDRHPRGGRAPQPRPLTSCTPARFVQGRTRLRRHTGACLLHGRGPRGRRRRRQMPDRAHTPLAPTEGVEEPRGRALRPAIRPGTPRADRLGAWTHHPSRHAGGPGGVGRLPPPRPGPPMHVGRGHHGLERRHLAPVMTLRLGGVAVQGRPAPGTVCGVPCEDCVALFAREPRPRLPTGSGWSPRTPSARLTATARPLA